MKNDLTRRRAPERKISEQPLQAVSGPEKRGVKVVVIDGGLHSRLKEMAAREGKKLQALVELKLRELVEVEA